MDDYDLPLGWLEILEGMCNSLAHLPSQLRNTISVPLEEFHVALVVVLLSPVDVRHRFSQVRPLVLVGSPILSVSSFSCPLWMLARMNDDHMAGE